MAQAIVESKTRIIDLDLSAYFDNVARDQGLNAQTIARFQLDGEVFS